MSTLDWTLYNWISTARDASRIIMANYYVSITMALPRDAIPEPLTGLEDLAAIYRAGAALDSHSRKNWLIYAVEQCASHYGAARLSFMSQVTSILDPTDANLAAQELAEVLVRIEQSPASLSALLRQDAWTEDEIRAMLRVDASPWGPLTESDDGDELPYLVSFLVAQLALLRFAVAKKLYVAFAQTAPRP